MRLRRLFADDDAVSPVIGVILMVAITVILAAVIATFVLGLGQNQNASPQASFAFDYDNTTNPGGGTWDGNLTTEHNTGDSIPEIELFFRGSDFQNTGDSWENYNTNGLATTSGSAEGEPAVVAGDSADFGANSTYEVRLVWESPEGDSSNTLASKEGPDA